jgi:hypothetical protein
MAAAPNSLVDVKSAMTVTVPSFGRASTASQPSSVGVVDRGALQPMRFSTRRSGDLLPFCISSVAAANVLNGYVCMTTDTIDADVAAINLTHVAQAAIAKGKDLASAREDMLEGLERAGEANAKKYGTSEYGVSAWLSTDMTQGMVWLISNTAQAMTDAKQGCNAQFRAFKLGTPGHVAIALWNVPWGIIEVFDPSGSSSSNVDTARQERLLKLLWGSVPLPKIVFVNDRNLQDKADKFCQTWIFYYADQRARLKRPAQEIIGRLHKLSADQRFELIATYWHTLIRSGGKIVGGRGGKSLGTI